MTYFEDLTPCDYFNRGRQNLELSAVGWLDGDRAFSTGPVQRGFLEKLEALFENPWAPFFLMGWHSCHFCPHRKSGAKGVKNLFIPYRGTVYVAPELIYHYIVEHGYCPPAAFQDPVLECPEMNSDEYFSALKRCKIARREGRLAPRVTRDQMSLTAPRLLSILASIIDSPLTLLDSKDLAVPLPAQVMKEILMVGAFRPDSPQLVAVEVFLESHRAELLRCVRKVEENLRLTADDLAFVDRFVAPG